MQPYIGDWWTMDDRGEGVAHRVGAVLPDVARGADQHLITYDYSEWIPLCSCGIKPMSDDGSRFLPRTESATLFSTFKPGTEQHPRCSVCEVMSPGLDRWLERRSVR